MTSINRVSRVVWLYAASAVVSIVALVLTLVLYSNLSGQQGSDIGCVTDWANATAARSDRILDLSVAKNKATDDLFRAVAKKDAKAFNQALSEYLTASNDYDNAVRTNPLPPSPQLQCGHKPKAFPAPVVVTKTAPGGLATTTTVKPGPTMRSTVTVPQVTTAAGGTRAMPVPVPGPRVTVTRVRTVTRTVAPPACLQRPLPPCVLQLPPLH